MIFHQDPTILSSSKFAPMTSADIKRSFSVFKNILTDSRHSFAEEKLETHTVIHFK